MTPEEIVNKMYSNDPFSKWLGITINSIEKGNTRLSLHVNDQMLNGFGIAHGGISYALADSALAFSVNSLGVQSVSLETSISHTKAINKNDTITAHVNEVSLTRKTGIYEIKIYNQNKELVAFFKGVVYRTDKDWQ